MTQGWIVVPVSLAYLGLLFLIAWYGDRQKGWLARYRSWIYSLSIAVYCTSWTFYGTVGQATNNPWAFLPIYLAPIFVFVFAWRFLARIILIAKREHITSIADFIAARYGKSQGLAGVITIIAVIGILPYIALQLRGITMGLDLVAPNLAQDLGYQDGHISWFVGGALAIFTILFGTRHIDTTEHHRGLMMAVAFESIVKLIAFLSVGGFIVYLAYSEPSIDLISVAKETYQSPNLITLLFHTLLTMAAIICLPRQFHTIVVENERAQDLRTARWVFPLYLLLMGLFVLPISWAGQALLSGDIASDGFIISVPLSIGADHMALLAFVGGTSAASGMVIVSTIALAIMVSNDLVLPLLLRRVKTTARTFGHFSNLLVTIRRLLIVLLLVGAWGFYQALDSIESLSVIGLLAFAAIAQFAPALIGGLYWRQGNKKGVYAGLAIGFMVWLITLMSQTQMLAGSAENNVLLWIITPPEWLQQLEVKASDWGMMMSLGLNAVLFIVVSFVTRASLSERLQAAAFVGAPLPESEDVSVYQTRVTVGELEMLASRFVGRKRARKAFRQFAEQQSEELLPQQQASSQLIRHTERVLAGVFGASSSRLVLTSALQGRNMQLEEVATIVDEASELYDFSRGLLQGAIEHISQGIAVVDKQMKLVAWNQRYLELFTFPSGLIQVGRPIADVIRHNAEQGLCGPGDPEIHVQRRVEHLERGTRHVSSRIRADGQVIEVQGNPMPNGGFVMSFSDITVFRQAEKALKETNETLESRVHERTRELEKLNQRLVGATQSAEKASHSKTRLLAAVSHDLMQPLNAARLFASSLSEVAKDGETKKISGHIESALGAAEELIGDLLDISRLEAGKLETNVYGFSLNSMLSNLEAEFGALAKQQGIDFNVIHSNLVVESDPKLLRRVLQNFLTNAFRYNPQGKVVLGARRVEGKIRLDVWDSGIGIPEEKQQAIFDEFTRVDQSRADQGLGLGLAIARGISHVLGHTISLRSWVNKGSVFSVTLDHGVELKREMPTVAQKPELPLSSLRVLCVDNEPDILIGMESLLQRWGCEVKTATDLFSSLHCLENDWSPDVIFSDYRLDNDRTGLEVLQQCRLRLGNRFEGVMISADKTDDLLESIKSNGFGFIAKPVKPLKLRAVLNRHVSS
ncbi:PAS domain-containing hybrid sensor histidine kinase/response regulator [Aliivibrio sifiae]|uniref:histidine kinase n=1 Tax=Aliivibrio sifiae TaxID=566293 RepID=A0A2S7XLE6_9GAMM|nr:PAS domain-containing hybrid sensor histidine kinase/response regulator [Aliivibrio sifiae]PQJ94567.1 hybrid sensor histidine kinase/response regulator [Aliivibrio sifiae]GLR75624.1 sensor histidine kinase [Aliivibrio sifiae]